MAHHHKLGCLLKRLVCSVVVKVKVTERVQNSNACSFGVDDISSTDEPYVTKLGMVMRHHGSECHTKRLVCYKFRVTVRAHIVKHDCFYHINCTADLFATKLNLMVDHPKMEYFM